MCQTKLHRHEPRTANTRGGDTFRDCPAWRRQILNRDTSPNHRHGFTSEHEQDYNPTWTTITLAPCHTYSPLCDNSPSIHRVFLKVLPTQDDCTLHDSTKHFESEPNRIEPCSRNFLHKQRWKCTWPWKRRKTCIFCLSKPLYIDHLSCKGLWRSYTESG